MTVLIWDGENILMDRVQTINVRDIEQPLYADTDKIMVNDGTWKATLDGLAIKFFAFIGDVAVKPTFVRYMQHPCEINNLYYWDLNAPKSAIFPIGTTVFFLTADDTLHRLCTEIDDNDPDRQSMSWRMWEAERRKKLSALTWGCNETIADHFIASQYDDGRRITAIEAMVNAQANRPVLGKTFDHYHIPSGKVTKHINLSSRQRRAIAAKMRDKITWPYEAKGVEIST